MYDLIEKRIGKMLEVIESDFLYEDKLELGNFKTMRVDYKKDNTLPSPDCEQWQGFSEHERWGANPDEHRWFYKRVYIPEAMKGKNVLLYVAATDLNDSLWDSQYLVYVDGKMNRGMDSNHRFLELDSSKPYSDVYIYAYSSPKGILVDLFTRLYVINKDIERLFYNIKVPFDSMKVIEKDSKEYYTIKNALNDALNILDLRNVHSEDFYNSVKAANAFLEDGFYKNQCKISDVHVKCIGHTHIDVAWRWTLEQTREKTQRTFSSVVKMMKKYPEYKFMSSQPQLYKFVKEDAPEVYEEIKKLVKQGRWEVEGAMWLEADCNLPSGESLVRQVLHGKRFMKEEFGVDSKVLWLPDVFGYSAALPQILQKSGVNKFVTSKISWNETNQMPYDTFNWYGIDGTSIFSYFMTAVNADEVDKRYTAYTAELTPSQMIGAWKRYNPKQLNDEVMLTFGYGDGGGGPSDEYLENFDRLKHGIPGLPTPQIEFAGTFLENLCRKLEKNPKLPKWVGELYLEFHRGTYTSIAKNKKKNRKSEFLYENAELMSVAANKLLSCDYSHKALYDGWEMILLNQFHDIIPGSSIKAVYDRCDKDYEKIFATGNKVLTNAFESIKNNISTSGGILVFNPNSFEGNSVVEVEGNSYYVTNIPPKGYKVVKPESQKASYTFDGKTIETEFYKITFADDFTISEMFDKKNKRNVLRKGGRGNVIEVFDDYPYEYDAWEISRYYEEKKYEINSVESVEMIDKGAKFGIEIKRKFLNSTFEQTIWFYNNSARIDFETVSDWKESHHMLKAAFDVDINSDKATYDIQFGSVERSTHANTSWDAAKFEVCAHKFIDYSEYNYGVSLLNDCKYGHNIKNSTMKISLFKCATEPNPAADKEVHKFTYSLFPHAGDFRKAGTVKLAYDLNNPMTAMNIEAQQGILPEEFSLVKPDCESFVVETVKKAEDSDSIIVRGYDSYNTRRKVKLTFGFDISSASLCDLMENDISSLEIKDNAVSFEVKPFEIISIKVN